MTELHYATAERVAPCCEYNRRWEERYGVEAERLRTVYLRPRRERASPRVDRELREEPVIAWAGRIDPIKDVETLLRAAAIVVAERPEVTFKLYGSASTDPAGLRRDLPPALARARARGQRHSSRAGRPARRTRSPMPTSSSLTSISEAFPFSTLEALLCARPVVATAVGGVPEQVTPDSVGMVVPPRDAAPSPPPCSRCSPIPERWQRAQRRNARSWASGASASTRSRPRTARSTRTPASSRPSRSPTPRRPRRPAMPRARAAARAVPERRRRRPGARRRQGPPQRRALVLAERGGSGDRAAAGDAAASAAPRAERGGARAPARACAARHRRGVVDPLGELAERLHRRSLARRADRRPPAHAAARRRGHGDARVARRHRRRRRATTAAPTRSRSRTRSGRGSARSPPSTRPSACPRRARRRTARRSSTPRCAAPRRSTPLGGALTVDRPLRRGRLARHAAARAVRRHHARARAQRGPRQAMVFRASVHDGRRPRPRRRPLPAAHLRRRRRRRRRADAGR